MQRNLWMRPALQKSEAVLLPALPRARSTIFRFSDRFTHVKAAEDPFRPVSEEATPQSLALSTYVRPRGSMGGRGVLRAAGVSGEPFTWRAKPRYHVRQGRTRAPEGTWRA